jgi:2-polyprenyl-3-methyl-5-hydroxy-6-metoxy-1,4-benzoquinol methylase
MVTELEQAPVSEAPRFTLRPCPACGSEERRTLFELNASQFCRANYTYAENYNELLGLAGNELFPIDRCVACGFIYARLLPADDFLKLVYDKVISFNECYAGSENGAGYARRMRYVATLMDLCAVKDNFHALDFGCGLGVTLRLLRSVNATVIGYDPSPVRADSIKTPGITVLRTLDQIESLEEKFDMVVFDNVLEHVPEPAHTIRLIGRLCKPGAVVFVSVPSYEDAFLERQLEAISKGEMIDMTLNPWEHLNYFNRVNLDRMLLSAGFESIKAAQLPENIDIGLRPETNRSSRIKNSLASTVRMIRYVALGDVGRSVEYSFYVLRQGNEVKATSSVQRGVKCPE